MAIFENLSSRLTKIVDGMRGKSRVTDKDITDMMREIRLALLEADVNYEVVRDLSKDIREKARGADVMQSLTPGQQIVKIVHETIIQILGEQEKLIVSPTGFTVIMLYGLQGTGKTTTAAKLANFLKKEGKTPMLVSVDVHRPAAQEQLKILADQVGVECYIDPDEKSAAKIAKDGRARARYMMCDTLIVDTAGRMTVDEDLMAELKTVNDVIKPDEKLLIVDAMIGQEAVSIAQAFEEEIGVLGAAAEVLSQRPVWVSYNGRTFDEPFLNGRLRYYLGESLAPKLHIDLLRHVRRHYRGLLPDCRLTTVETYVLDAYRSGDVPGYMIPELYYQFVLYQEPSLLEMVLLHNSRDLQTLVQLLGVIQGL